MQGDTASPICPRRPEDLRGGILGAQFQRLQAARDNAASAAAPLRELRLEQDRAEAIIARAKPVCLGGSPADHAVAQSALVLIERVRPRYAADSDAAATSVRLLEQTFDADWRRYRDLVEAHAARKSGRSIDARLRALLDAEGRARYPQSAVDEAWLQAELERLAGR